MSDTCKLCGAPLPIAGQPYPSRHQRGETWFGDEAWDIVDRIPPGMVSPDWRMMLSGLIAGAISRVAEDPQAAIDKWETANAPTTGPHRK